MTYDRLYHSIAPVFDSNAKILILGSFPSVKSRDAAFFYAHPQNRFWRVLTAVCNSPIPESIDDKKQFLLDRQIALWDVIAACDIVGSADGSIKNAVPNDLNVILKRAEIRRIFVNGKTAEKVYNRYIRDTIGREAVLLPSTSPANAAWSLERLIEAWSVINQALLTN